MGTTVKFVAGLDESIEVADTVAVYFGAASCHASIQAQQQLAQLKLHCGSVIAPEYDLSGGYDHNQTYEQARSRLLASLAPEWSGKLLIVGASMGAINALRLADSMLQAGYDVRVIFEDPVLSAVAMKPGERKGAQVLTRLPAFMQDLLPHAMLDKMLPDHGPGIWEPEVNDEVQEYFLHAGIDSNTPVPHVLRVQQDLQDLTVRGFLSFAVPILSATVPTGVLAGKRVAVINSGIDPVRDLSSAAGDTDSACENADRVNIQLKAGHHVAFAERPAEWGSAFSQAIDHTLGK